MEDGTQAVSIYPDEFQTPALSLTLTHTGHPIADAHPGNLDNIIYPGQDFNNARVYDFADVAKWDQNKREVEFAG